MGKTINTEAIIKSITIDENTSSETLENIKGQRFSQISEKKETSQSNKDATKEKGSSPANEKIDSASISQTEILSKTERKIWNEFNKVLESEFYRDKKDVFLMSLSGKCLSQYEKLALGVGFKLGRKVNRNEIIRKVLEDYMQRHASRLETVIQKL